MSNKNVPSAIAIKKILEHYPINLSFFDISLLGNGHINYTYKVNTADGDFVLQQINHDIFTNPIELSSNAQKINLHLNEQKKQKNYSFVVPQQLATKSGQHCLAIDGCYWRLMEFISHSHTLETIHSAEQAALVAEAFAQFSCALSDFNAIYNPYEDGNSTQRVIDAIVKK